MEKRRYIKQEWRKNWKYLQEKLPITTGWVTDGVSDDITNKEVTEEIMGLLDRAREEGTFTKEELEGIGELLGFMESDYPGSYWKPVYDKIKLKLTTK